MEEKPKYLSKEWRRLRYVQDKEKHKSYYERNKERIRAYSKQYAKDNAERIKALRQNPKYDDKRKAWFANHQDYMREYHREYYHRVLVPKKEEAIMKSMKDLFKRSKFKWMYRMI